ncbi:MAG TPA: HDOD domain-containing protein [Dissulfurispiraceae bacterium]|nr:HDOD domain-containing protein [Dissulfurispiraceae bacterium]
MDTGKGNVTDVKDKIQRLSNLPSLAVVKYQLVKTLNRESASINDISDIIRHDQAIASRVLAVANSAFLGFPGKIDALEQAIMLLGFDLVRSISLAASIFSVFASQYGNFKQMWAHSYIVGGLAARICDKTSGGDRSACFLAGLLHDIGRLTLFKIASDSSIDGEVQALLHMKGEDLLKAESSLFHCNHTDAAKWFLDNLCFPADIIDPIEKHHGVISEGPNVKISNMIFLAEGLSDIICPQIVHDGQWSEAHQKLFHESGFGDADIEEIRTLAAAEQDEIAQFFDL